MDDNPFIPSAAPPSIEGNPFLDLEETHDEPDEEIELGYGHEELMTAKGSPRARRPDGSTYSTDPSERAKQLIEDGKFGGSVARVGAVTRRKRAAQVVAEMAAKESGKIRKVFEDGIAEGNPISVRISAAKEILKVEDNEAALEQREREREYGRMTKGELVEDILAGLAALSRAGMLADGTAAIEVADADVVEEPDDDSAAA